MVWNTDIDWFGWVSQSTWPFIIFIVLEDIASWEVQKISTKTCNRLAWNRSTTSIFGLYIKTI